MAQTPYEILGVAKDADADVIRKAYRKLAREHHPDVNPGNKASEDRFKDISAAYETLSDPKKRAEYDEQGRRPPPPPPYQRRQSPFEDDDQFDFSELFNRQRRSRKGQDLSATVQMSLRQAVEGGEVGFDIPGQGTVRVRIPPGADTGSTIRIPGRGGPGEPAGDLVIEMEVAEHPLLRRDGLDLYLSVPVTLDEAYNGGSIDVPTFDGTVAIKIPPRSQAGAKLRLKNKGIARKDQRGDFYAVLDVRMPDKEDAALAAALKANLYSTPVRKDLAL